jgi:large subunit ribosomal protein L30
VGEPVTIMTRKEQAGPAKAVKVTLVKSTIGFNRRQAEVVRGMGLRRIGHTVQLQDTPATRGMIYKVRHLVRVEN